MKTYKQFINENLLLEIFTSSLPLTRNKKHENMLKNMVDPNETSDIEMYDTTHEGKPYHFMRMKHKGKYEVHFGDFFDPTNARLNKHKGSNASHLIGTSVKLYKEKLDQGHPIRYMSSDPKLDNFYDKIFDHLAKNYKNVKTKIIKNYQGITGFVHPKAVEVSINN